MSRQPESGFTLLEMMVAVAIVGILAAITINGMSQMSLRAAPANASQDLLSALSAAKLRAVATGNDVWVLVYPQADRDVTSGGSGAYFVVEDRSGKLLANGYSDITPDNLVPNSEVSFQDRNYFEDYTRKNVHFAAQAGDALPAPFSVALASGCSFCSADGGDERGAVVFSGEGTARFVDGDGTVLSGTQYLALKGKDEPPARYAIALSGPTAFIGLFRLDK